MAKRSRYSYSSLSSYAACPAAWKQTYVDDDPGIVPQNVRDGANAHNGIARYAEVCFKGGKRPAKYDREAGYLIADSYPEPTRSTLRGFVEAWQWEFGSMVGTDGKCPVEQEFTAKLPCGREFSGHVDLLRCLEGAASSTSFFGEDDDAALESDDLWVVTDWKNRAYASEMVQVRKDCAVPLQLLTYAWLTQSSKPEARNFDLRYYLLAGYEVPAYQVAGDLAWVGELLSERCEVMDRDVECEPCMGRACDRCFHKLTCPLHDQATWAKHVDETPESKLAQMLWHSAQADALKDDLKGLAQERGLVAVPGFVYEGRQNSSLVLREGADLSPFGYTEFDFRGGFDKNKIRSAKKKMEDEALREAFLLQWEEKPGSLRYAAYKVGNGADSGSDDQ